MSDDRSTFEVTRARLEDIVTQVRRKDVSLEQSLDLLEEAVRLVNKCNDLIDQTSFRPVVAEDGAEAAASGAATAVGEAPAAGGTPVTASAPAAGEAAAAEGAADDAGEAEGGQPLTGYEPGADDAVLDEIVAEAQGEAAGDEQASDDAEDAADAADAADGDFAPEPGLASDEDEVAQDPAAREGEEPGGEPRSEDTFAELSEIEFVLDDDARE